MTPLRILVLMSTTREGRFSELVAPWVVEGLRRRTSAEVSLLDLRDHPLPFFEGTAPARRGRDYPTDEARMLGERLDAADAFVILTAEYNHGYPAALKNAIDWTFVEWGHKPTSYVGWGNAGGARAIEQLRLVAVELESAPLRHAVHLLPRHMVAAREADATEPFVDLEPRLDLLADDLVWWANALRTAREG
ncbi:MAG: reductase [Nocardioidaceae bacterium]|nr:reductase [Nocardioidaceae bacterium]